MSFSSNVKSELAHCFGKARHCNIAEVAAMLNMCGHISKNGQVFCIKIQTENVTVARKYFTLVKKTFNIECEIVVRRNSQLKRNRVYILTINNKDEIAKKVLLATGILGGSDNGQVLTNGVNSLLVSGECCKRAYIRGAFLASGSISAPEKTYHMEFVCSDYNYSEDLRDVINSFGMEAKIVKRKENYVVYLKEGEQIVDLLNVMGAHVALMDMENVRILKDMRNNVNRKVNCETANLNKTITASVKQMEDILFIKDNRGLGYLPNQLEEMAAIRIEYPEASLKELGQMLEPPVGKSGVNHRLRKISEMAEFLREDMVRNNG